MSFEDRLRETLRRAVAPEPVVQTTYVRLMERSRRFLVARVAVASASVAVVVAGLAVALPRIGGEPEPGFAGSPTPSGSAVIVETGTPSPSPSPASSATAEPTRAGERATPTRSSTPKPTETATGSPEEECRAQHGTVPGSIVCDERTVRVIAFLDRRIEGSGAESSLTQNAKDQYDDHDCDLYLYSPTSNPHYDRWRIVNREDVDASSSDFGITIVEEYTGGGTTEFDETLHVGAGTNYQGQNGPAWVRGAEKDPCPTPS